MKGSYIICEHVYHMTLKNCLNEKMSDENKKKCEEYKKIFNQHYCENSGFKTPPSRGKKNDDLDHMMFLVFS